MKCAKCQMVNQIPETPCSHCGRPLPALVPTILKVDPEDDNANQAEAEEAQNETASEAESETTNQAEATTEEEVTPEDGHVDNVGDESESETILP